MSVWMRYMKGFAYPLDPRVECVCSLVLTFSLHVMQLPTLRRAPQGPAGCKLVPALCQFRGGVRRQILLQPSSEMAQAETLTNHLTDGRALSNYDEADRQHRYEITVAAREECSTPSAMSHHDYSVRETRMSARRAERASA